MSVMDEIEVGAQIEVTDALGRVFVKRALSGVMTEGQFPAVWACSADEWAAAEAEGREPEPEPFPWPMASVRVLELVG